MTRSQKQRSSRHASYPDDWPKIATHVKELANWRCERCGHPHETPTRRAECDDGCSHDPDGKQRILTVHHLDMDKSNCQLSNLVALCQSCHLSIQSRVDVGQAWMFDLPGWLQTRLEMREEGKNA